MAKEIPGVRHRLTLSKCYSLDPAIHRVMRAAGHVGFYGYWLGLARNRLRGVGNGHSFPLPTPK